MSWGRPSSQNTNNNNGKQICKFYLENRCRFGSNCNKSHEQPNQSGFGSFSGGFSDTSSSANKGNSKEKNPDDICRKSLDGMWNNFVFPPFGGICHTAEFPGCNSRLRNSPGFIFEGVNMTADEIIIQGMMNNPNDIKSHVLNTLGQIDNSRELWLGNHSRTYNIPNKPITPAIKHFERLSQATQNLWNTDEPIFKKSANPTAAPVTGGFGIPAATTTATPTANSWGAPTTATAAPGFGQTTTNTTNISTTPSITINAANAAITGNTNGKRICLGPDSNLVNCLSDYNVATFDTGIPLQPPPVEMR